MKYFLMIWLFAVVATVILLGPRGANFKKPPLYLFPDMDMQPKALAQSENEFFEDRRVNRPEVPGTVGRGQQWDVKQIFEGNFRYPVAANPPLYTGLNDGFKRADMTQQQLNDPSWDGWYRGFPTEVDEPFLQLGAEKYEQFCTVCHGVVGDGNGVLSAGAVGGDAQTYASNRGYFPYIADLTDEKYRNYPEGQLWDRITNGYNTMYPYNDKLTPHERWAVVAYVRALQLAAHARVADVPEAERSQLGL